MKSEAYFYLLVLMIIVVLLEFTNYNSMSIFIQVSEFNSKEKFKIFNTNKL